MLTIEEQVSSLQLNEKVNLHTDQKILKTKLKPNHLGRPIAISLHRGARPTPSQRGVTVISEQDVEKNI